MYHEYPPRVMLQEDGAYRWRCATDVAYERKNLRTGLIACVGIAVGIVVFGVIMSVMHHTWEFMGVILGCTAVFLAISLVIFLGISHVMTDPQEIYEMREELVMFGSGKRSAYASYDAVRRVVVMSRCMDLKCRISTIRIYMPEEDAAFVKSYILTRVNPVAEIVYE